MEYLKLLTGELCYALLGNINRNIASVSFNIKDRACVQLQFILIKKSENEEELIEDIIDGFEAIHGSNLKELNWTIFLSEENKELLTNVVFQKYKES